MATREQLVQLLIDLGKAAIEEMQAAPAGSAAALGDGTLLRLFLELLPLIMELLKNWPT